MRACQSCALLLVLRGGLLAQPAPVDYLPAIRTVEDFDLVSVPSQLGGETERLTKYTLPASADPALLPPAFQNVARFPFHFEFLKTVFPDKFPGLTIERYLDLVERRATRRYFAGAVSRFRTDAGGFYGFSIFTATGPGELLSAEETRAVYEAFAKVFDLRPLYYAPETAPARAAAGAWRDPGFPVYLGQATQASYQAYTRATGYGRVRVLTLPQFDEANQSGRFTWQDILVLERAPSDIEGVVAGVVTAEPQGELSHVAIRSARRGTPNAYLAGALERFRPLEGKLVKLEVKAAEYAVAEAGLAEAEAFWREHRPKLSEEPRIDPDHAAFDSLDEMDLSGAVVPPEARYGGKASNFARLQRILTGPFEKYRERGFAVPARYYLEFLRSNRMESAVEPGRLVTYEEHLRELLASATFRSDPEARFEALERFREAVEDDGAVDPKLVAGLARRIGEVFGSTGVPVRFRSSSNVEDALEFNGAGLYDSTTACADDDLDLGDGGPSRCDPAQPRERGIARALKKVWASLWSFRAFEEREYYQIQQQKAVMAVLVSAAYLDEQANGVAFTGNPANALDRRYLVTAQTGEESVVSPEPGKTPEKDVLEVEGGVVTRIERVERSSLVPPGQVVLSDAVLRELGALLWRIDREMPVDLGKHDRAEVLFDIELKVEASGELAVKQVRPFLIQASGPPGPVFELEVPSGAAVCGVFVDGRDPRGELEAKSIARLVPGKHPLPTDFPSFPGRLFEEVLHGPGPARAAPAGGGRFRVEVRAEGNGNATYTFRYAETFALPGAEELVLEISFLDFEVRRDGPPPGPKVLDEAFLTDELVMLGVPGEDRTRLVRYSSCSYDALPLWQVRAELEGGDLVELEERYRVPQAGSGPASLVGARVAVAGAVQEARDYWRLVYAAQHHNERVRYWVVLDPPLALPGGGAARIVELNEPQRDRGVQAQAAYLAADFKVLARPQVLCWQKALAGRLGACGFRRGDADSSGGVDLTDAVFLLLHLFQGGPAPACEDASDFNDDGIQDITDAILILTFLFRGVDLSEPPGPYDCGPDPTQDGLAECGDGGCG
ncbi:MAG: hypothetical protein HY721_09465 [Planctomycetes bacterium]|nr:hypothetical protein [Planctomycetota bacterium]